MISIMLRPMYRPVHSEVRHPGARDLWNSVTHCDNLGLSRIILDRVVNRVGAT